MRLAGKKALITGGSRGIGAAMAKRFAEEGADVAITYNASQEKANKIVKHIEAQGQKGFAIKADATSPETLAPKIEEAIEKLGGVDILINNAGGGPEQPDNFENTTLEEFDRIMSLNLRAVYVTTSTAQKHMKEGGRIIMISSILGERAIFTGAAVYNTSKFALTGLGRSWAHDFGARGITVNIIQPGPIDTDLNPADGEFAADFIARTPLGRYGTPDEVAALAVFLASDESSYITGATINVDGGVNA